MTQKSEHTRHQRSELYASNQAAKLTRLAMRMQRADKKHINKLLEAADLCLRNYKMARFVGDDKAVGTIDDQVAEDLEVPMQALADVIKDTIAPRAFCLLVFSPDEAGDEGAELGYVSNAHRDDICEAMREFIVAHERAKE